MSNDETIKILLRVLIHTCASHPQVNYYFQKARSEEVGARQAIEEIAPKDKGEVEKGAS